MLNEPRKTGRDLAAERVRADLRQRDVAAVLGVSRQRVHALERAARPSVQAARRYLAAVAAAERDR